MDKTRYKVIDTSIIMDGPESFLKAFTPDEGTTYCIIPIDVLHELDHLKTSNNKDRSQTSRRALRTLSEQGNLYEGITMQEGSGRAIFVSDLYHQFKQFSERTTSTQPTTSKADGRIVDLAYQLNKAIEEKKIQGSEVEVVSNDIALQIIAQAQGLQANNWQDYNIIRSIDDLYKGWRDIRGLPGELYAKLQKNNTIGLEELTGEMEDGRSLDDLVKNPRPNEYFIATNNVEQANTGVIRWDASDEVFVKLFGYTKRKNQRIKARTIRQACLMDALRQEHITLVNAIGAAGTGKTFVAIEAGIELCEFDEEHGIRQKSKGQQSLTAEKLEQMIITRPTESDEKDKLGFIPGDIDNKFGPHITPIKQNIKAIAYAHGLSTTAANTLWDSLRSNKDGEPELALLPLQYMRGQTLMRAYIIADEMQNTKQEKAKTLLSRAEGISRVVITGDPKQIDPPYLNETNNALVLANQAHEWDETAASIVFEPEDIVRSKRAARSVEMLEKLMKK